MTKTNASTPNPWLRLLPGLLVTAAAVVGLFYFIDVDQLGPALRIADFSWFPLVVLLFFGTLLTRSLAWRTILQERASIKEAFLVVNQAYLLNNVLPFRLGELGRALLISNRAKLSFWEALSTVVVERVFDLGLAAALLLFTLPLVVGAEWARTAAYVSLGLVVIGFALLFWMASNPKQVPALIQRLTGRWPALREWLVDKAGAFTEGLSALRDGKRFLQVLFWMVLTWLFNVAWYFVLMRAFFPMAQWLWAFFSIGVSSLGVALPSSPGYIGVFEGVLVGALSFFNADPAISLAYAVVGHLTYFVITGIIGIIGFWQQGESLGDIYRTLLNRQA
ncbi:MAG: flippase-like domain-containing protein [Anaerolineales bacterium]|nr:flippase-like domain-containing protein [Anaerolineales bacterium]